MLEDPWAEGSTGITRLCTDGQSKLGGEIFRFDSSITLCYLKSNLGMADGCKGGAQRDFDQIAFSNCGIDIHPLVVNLTYFDILLPQSKSLEADLKSTLTR